jgi:pSer/pThr/pTyr-binding forkhead associated (FHA) protein
MRGVQVRACYSRGRWEAVRKEISVRGSDCWYVCVLRDVSGDHADLYAEENEQPVTEEAKRRISPIGQIVLYFYYTDNLEDVGSVEVPRLDLGQTEALSHKAVKAKGTPGDSLTCQTR